MQIKLEILLYQTSVTVIIYSSFNSQDLLYRYFALHECTAGKVRCTIYPTLKISPAIATLKQISRLFLLPPTYSYKQSRALLILESSHCADIRRTPITFEWQSTESTSYAKWRMNTSISYFHLPGLSYVAVYSLLQITPTRKPLIAGGEINC